MEAKLIHGDYVPDGLGGIVHCSGDSGLLARVLFRLTARRGQFPLLPKLGSRLYLLGRERPDRRGSAARQYVVEALAEEDVSVTDVAITPTDTGRIQLRVELQHRGHPLAADITV